MKGKAGMKKIRRAVQSDSGHSLSRRSFMQTVAALPLMLALPGNAWAAGNIHRISGEVFVNNRLIKADARVRAGSKVVVAHDGELVFSIGKDAFLLRGGTALELVGSTSIAAVRLLTGSMLVSLEQRSKPAQLVSSVAVMTVRGSAVYLSAEPNRLYACTCYGKTNLRAGKHLENIVSSHHTAYEVIKEASEKGSTQLNSAAVIDHTDEELIMLEAYVGRTPTFTL